MSSKLGIRSVLLGTVIVSALVLASPLMAASSSVSKSLQNRFVAIDTPFARAASAWSVVVEAVPASASMPTIVKALDKVSPAYEAAIKTFSSELAALKLPGKAGVLAAEIIKHDKQFSAVLAAAGGMSKTQFQQAVGSLYNATGPLGEEFRQALGLPASDAIQI